LRPTVDGVFYLGYDDGGNNRYRWTEIYGKIIRCNQIYNLNGEITTSDRNKKKNISLLNEKFIHFFNKLEPVSYNFTRPESDRLHIGFIS
jgi:hypothetical protein